MTDQEDEQKDEDLDQVANRNKTDVGRKSNKDHSIGNDRHNNPHKNNAHNQFIQEENNTMWRVQNEEEIRGNAKKGSSKAENHEQLLADNDHDQEGRE